MLRRIMILMIAGLMLVIGMPIHAQLEDSEMIAFESNMDGDFDIYIYNLAEDGLTNITNNDASDRNPVWSVDGRIAFTSSQLEGYERAPCIWSDGDISCLEYDEVINPLWSPDGRLLAFHHFNDVFVWDGQQTMSILADGVDGVISKSWSPDGVLMYTGSINGVFNIYLWDGTAVTRFPDNPPTMGFDWSSDGWLVYRSGVDAPPGITGWDLYVWDGTESVNITNLATIPNVPPFIINTPDWSADGQVAFIFSTAPNTGDIVVWDGERADNLTNDPDGNYGSPQWNAYGLLAYAAAPLEGSSTLYIWDGDTEMPIFEADGAIRGLAWSRTGERLLFVAPSNGGRDIYVWDGGEVFNLTDNGAFNDGAVWQP